MTCLRPVHKPPAKFSVSKLSCLSRNTSTTLNIWHSRKRARISKQGRGRHLSWHRRTVPVSRMPRNRGRGISPKGVQRHPPSGCKCYLMKSLKRGHHSKPTSTGGWVKGKSPRTVPPPNAAPRRNYFPLAASSSPQTPTRRWLSRNT